MVMSESMAPETDKRQGEGSALCTTRATAGQEKAKLMKEVSVPAAKRATYGLNKGRQCPGTRPRTDPGCGKPYQGIDRCIG